MKRKKVKNKMFENIIKSIQNSAEGWKMFFGGGMQSSAQFGGDISRSEIGGALIGPGFSAAQQRFAGIKAGEVVQVMQNSAQAPVGVRYMTSGRSGSPITPLREVPGVVVEVPDPGTPATVVERIQKSISNSAEGWRMGFASVIGKAQTLSGNISERMLKTQRGVEKSVAGVGEWFGNLGEGMSSMKWLLYIVVFVLIFVAVMTSIGYSGVGGPAARVAEKEYGRRR